MAAFGAIAFGLVAVTTVLVVGPAALPGGSVSLGGFDGASAAVGATSAATSKAPSALPGGSPVASDNPSGSASPTPEASPAPRGSADPSALASPSPEASAGPSASVVPGAAPTAASGFRVRDTIIPMGFPLAADAGYHFGDGWRARRAGVVYGYNQIRGVTADGGLLRAHDGVDIEVALGVLVYSPLAGVVVDPALIWRPWDTARYGKTVVIRSTEPTSEGYHVLFAHLSRQSVAVGRTVRRGQIVGRTGRTGNAQATAPHLHVEIRAPFLIDYHYAGVHRRLDVFDAEPSLRAADPDG